MADYLKYDTKTGDITDDNNIHVYSIMGHIPVKIERKEKSTSIDDMIKLKNSGFTADEVIAIKKANL